MAPEFTEPRFTGEIRGGFALFDAALEKHQHICDLARRRPQIQMRLKLRERQLDRVQREVGCFVVRVGGAVSKFQTYRLEAGSAMLHKLAHSLRCGVRPAAGGMFQQGSRLAHTAAGSTDSNAARG